MDDDTKQPDSSITKIPVKRMPHPASEARINQHSNFKTPEQVAANETADANPSNESDNPAKIFHHDSKQQKPKHKAWWGDLSKKKRVAIILLVVVLLLGGAGSIFALTKHTNPIAKIIPKKSTPQAVVSTTVASALTGLQVTPDINQRPVTGVMIENSTDARPQSGLDQAGVVFEAIAEGGITRFLALYQDTQPGYLGPVRSARPYYLQWCLGFDCALAHVGGSPEALGDIKTWGVRDLDQFANASAYSRIGSRIAPHNVYTSAERLNGLEGSKGFNSSHFTSLPRKADQPTKTSGARSIDFAISSSLYNVHYDYDPALNAYHRSEGGAGHVVVDSAGKQTQIIPKVVVGLVVEQGIEADDKHTSYTTVGSGPAYVFEDGALITGTWQRTSINSQITLSDAQGKPIGLNAGQTWFSVMGSPSYVSYKP